ncbi:hypothetical protein OUZ56_007608 [Daphnia magna]|uniref:Uncharacterized protein n=1 Tax=Daphnia magna TaxID=35525 RepID=A0ABR0AAW4_9CRUS|nr:hypothetical protein OUZ56_007608 [Daphnia magna]
MDAGGGGGNQRPHPEDLKVGQHRADARTSTPCSRSYANPVSCNLHISAHKTGWESWDKTREIC